MGYGIGVFLVSIKLNQRQNNLRFGFLLICLQDMAVYWGIF
jgi:hypothetical protein